MLCAVLPRTHLEALVGRFLLLLLSVSRVCVSCLVSRTVCVPCCICLLLFVPSYSKHVFFGSASRVTGGVIRLWRATALVARREENAHADNANVELRVQLLTDMLVGGFQVCPRPPGPSFLISIHRFFLATRRPNFLFSSCTHMLVSPFTFNFDAGDSSQNVGVQIVCRRTPWPRAERRF